MPSPVLMAALVVNGKLHPSPPPVHRMMALAAMAWTSPVVHVERHDTTCLAIFDQKMAHVPLVVAHDRRHISARSETGRAACGSRFCPLHLRCDSPTCHQRAASSPGRPDRGSTGSPSAPVGSPPAALRSRTPPRHPGRPGNLRQDGIPGVQIEAVVVTQNRCGTTLSRHRVATHRIHFRHHPNGEVGGYSPAAMAARRPAPPPPTRRMS